MAGQCAYQGHAWQGYVCGGGGMCGKGDVWQGHAWKGMA